MVPTSVIVCVVISILICVGVPLAGFIAMQARGQHIVKACLLGALNFVVMQMLLRMTLLGSVFPAMPWYQRMAQNPYWYGALLGLTAGLFEEVGRYLCFAFLLKDRRRYIDGIAFGLGHGGVEAMMLVGTTLLNTLLIMIAINGGRFEALTANVDAAQRQQILEQCLAITPVEALVGGFERLCAMAAHIGFTMLILTGIRNGKPGLYLAAAVLVHAVLDASIVILPEALGFTVMGLEAVFLVFALLLGGYALWVRRQYGAEPRPLA